MHRPPMTSRAPAPFLSLRWWARIFFGSTLVVALVAAGCGSGDDDDASSTGTTEPGTASADAEADGASADIGAYCEATLALETAGEPDIDFATASDAEIADAMRTFSEQTLRPLADEVVATAPAALAAEITVMSDALDQMIETGDFAAFETPEVTAASTAQHTFDVESCGWTSAAVEAADYSFSGLPDEIEAGVTSFELTNGGSELHEMVLFRRNDGVTQSFEELLALPEDQAMENVTMVGIAGPVPPGQQPGHAVADLEPGDYIALCFIPVGSVDPAGPPAEGPPHFLHGMQQQFTVA